MPSRHRPRLGTYKQPTKVKQYHHSCHTARQPLPARDPQMADHEQQSTCQCHSQNDMLNERLHKLITILSRLVYTHSGHWQFPVIAGGVTAHVLYSSCGSFGQSLYCCSSNSYAGPNAACCLPIPHQQTQKNKAISECTPQITVCHRLAAAWSRLARKLQPYMQYSSTWHKRTYTLQHINQQ